MKYSKSPYSLKELERFRDDEGFIDLDKAHIKMDKASTEPVGTTDRLKFWTDFNGHSALIKTDLKSLSGEDAEGFRTRSLFMKRRMKTALRSGSSIPGRSGGEYRRLT